MKLVKKKASENLLSGDLYFAASIFFREVDRLASKIYRPTGLSPSLAQLLIQLLHSTYRYPSFMANDLLLHRSTVSRLIQKLEKKGLVQNFPYDHLAVIEPTAKAWELEPKLIQCNDDFYEQCYRILGREQYERVTKILTGLADRLGGEL